MPMPIPARQQIPKRPKEPPRPMHACFAKSSIQMRLPCARIKVMTSTSIVHQPPPRTPLAIAQLIPLTRRRLESRPAVPRSSLP